VAVEGTNAAVVVGKEAAKGWLAGKAASLMGRLLGRVSGTLANQANHVFGDKNVAQHTLGGVLDSFGGDKIAAFRALEKSTQSLANTGAIKGISVTTVKVGESTVTVRGRVIDGVANISTALIP
jgi:hypothetical protein